MKFPIGEKGFQINPDTIERELWRAGYTLLFVNKQVHQEAYPLFYRTIGPFHSAKRTLEAFNKIGHKRLCLARNILLYACSHDGPSAGCGISVVWAKAFKILQRKRLLVSMSSLSGHSARPSVCVSVTIDDPDEPHSTIPIRANPNVNEHYTHSKDPTERDDPGLPVMHEFLALICHGQGIGTVEIHGDAPLTSETRLRFSPWSVVISQLSEMSLALLDPRIKNNSDGKVAEPKYIRGCDQIHEVLETLARADDNLGGSIRSLRFECVAEQYVEN